MSQVPDNEENAKKCICPECPTFRANECPKGKGETLYCARGKTKCSLPDKGCICGNCPLWTIYGLSKGYFCFNGKAE